MKICQHYNFRNATVILNNKKEAYADINKVFNESHLIFGVDKPIIIKKRIMESFNRYGWADRVKVEASLNLTINFIKNRVGLCFQIGNVARTYADILKFAILYKRKIIDVGVLIVPDDMESKKLGANYACFSRLEKELMVLDGIFLVPILVVGLSNQEGKNNEK